MKQGGPAGPQRPKRRWAYFTLGAFLDGFSLVSLVYLTGLLFLLGDPRQEVYILLGVVVGGLAFPTLGVVMARTLRHPLPWAVAIAIVGAVGTWFANTNYPVVPNLDLLLRSLLCTVGGLPLAILVMPHVVPDLRARRRFLWGPGLVIGPLVMAVVYSLIYAESGFQGFPYLILYTEEGAAALFVLVLLGMWRAGRRTGGPSPVSAEDGSKASTGAEDSPPAAAPARSSASTFGPERVRSHMIGLLRLRRRPWASSARQSSMVVFLPLLLAFLLLAPGVSPSSSTGGVSPNVASSPYAHGLTAPLTPIRHVISIMFENHAFDNIFGTYPSDPRPNPSASGVLGQLPVPNGLEQAPPAYGCPFIPGSGSCPSGAVEPVSNGTFSTADPYEGYTAYHIDWNQGQMNGWLDDSGSGTPALTTFTAAEMAPEWDVAQQYSLADAYFSSALTESNPNHLYAIAGYSPVINDYGPPPWIPFDETMPGELSAAGISWGYYLDNPSQGLGSFDTVQGVSASTPGVGSYATFESQLADGSLPAVSWLRPVDGGLTDEYSQGPPGNMLAGEMWLLFFLDKIMASPEWNSTAVFITYDEAGGYYDHVAPPVVDGEQLGMRIPLIVVSPYSKEAYVSHTVMNHASTLAFVDYNWGLLPLNQFVASSNLPLDMFDFSSPYPGGTLARAPLPLQASQGFPVPSGIPFTAPSSPDLAPLFPQPPQEPLATRPYASSGQSNVTLGASGSATFVATDVAYTPLELSAPFLTVVFAAEVVLWGGLIIWRAPRPSGGPSRASE